MTPNIDRPFRVQTSTLQPDISVIRIGTSNFPTETDRRLPGEKMSTDSTSNYGQEQEDEDQIEQGWYGVIHPDDETFAECYEVIYQMDSCYQNEKEQHTGNNDQKTIALDDRFFCLNIRSILCSDENQY